MDVADAVFEGHEAKGKLGWHELLIEHLMWLFSRALLIVFIVGLAFTIRVPFQKLMGGEALHDMEQMEKERQLEEFKLVQDLSVSAAKFQPAFADSAKAVVEYERTPGPDSKNLAETKVHRAIAALDRVRETFGNRKIQLHDDLEDSLNALINDGEAGLKTQGDVLRDASRSPKRVLTFDCNKTIIEKDVQGIGNYEQAYVWAKQQGAYGAEVR